MSSDAFPELRLKGALRPSQREVIAIARKQLAENDRRFYVVAPPGSGKTVLGLYLWAECARCPALVLSPNSAIQAQWAARMDLFEGGDRRPELASTNISAPALLTSLTYQAVTLPQADNTDLELRAKEAWGLHLIEKRQAKDPQEAALWIEDLRVHNPGYYTRRLRTYQKRIRDELSRSDAALELLHQSVIENLKCLREKQIGLLILDECHHLVGHWGRVLAELYEYLDHPMLLALTATPPDGEGRDAKDFAIFEKLLGETDYQVPVPAVVKDGFLAPYQDLVYFVRPTQDELRYIADADQAFRRMIDTLCEDAHTSAEVPPNEVQVVPCAPFLDWISEALRNRKLGTLCFDDWSAFEQRDPDFTYAARIFLRQRARQLPDGVPLLPSNVHTSAVPESTILTTLLDRYLRLGLRRSAHAADRARADQLVQSLRTFGAQVTETGTQACLSPVGRVLSHSKSKIEALSTILQAEQRTLGEGIRAVVITDFERVSSVSAELTDVLDSEAGGAVAAFKALVSDPVTDALNPILVTGSSVLVDDDLLEAFLHAARAWLEGRAHAAQLSAQHCEGFSLIQGEGEDWCPRVYIALITEIFQRGLSKCLVGTRGLLGEGWDANKVNVLIDLTSVTTSMSVNQLRGRSMRLDPEDSQKLADNWDVVCLAPEFTNGFADYQRFAKKHAQLFGVAEDGCVEKGVGHVHPGLRELKPDGVEDIASAFTTEMLQRVARRAQARARWRIGEPYHPLPIQAVELPKGAAELTPIPAFAGATTSWSDTSLTIAVSKAIIASLHEVGLIDRQLTLRVQERAAGYLRVFVDKSSTEYSSLFAQALRECFEPLDRPRYVIERKVTIVNATFLSSFLPEVIGRYFRKRQLVLAMLHAVPSVFAKNKQFVAIFQRHWHKHVGPGETYYAHHGEGERILEEALQQGLQPTRMLHEKQIFI